MTIKLGDKVRDSITKFTGVCVGRYEYLNGCVRFEVQPEKLGKEGLPVDSKVYDVQQLELVKAAATSVTSSTGGPYPTPARR